MIPHTIYARDVLLESRDVDSIGFLVSILNTNTRVEYWRVQSLPAIRTDRGINHRTVLSGLVNTTTYDEVPIETYAWGLVRITGPRVNGRFPIEKLGDVDSVRYLEEITLSAPLETSQLVEEEV